MLTRRASRFGVTGVATTGVHVIVAVVMIKLVSPSQSLANGVAFVLATVFSYVVNTSWSFSAQLRAQTFIRYSFAACVGFGLSVLVSALNQAVGWNYPMGIGLVLCIVPPVNFAMHHFWTYKSF